MQALGEWAIALFLMYLMFITAGWLLNATGGV